MTILNSRLTLKWLGVVLLNAVVGLFFGLDMSETIGGYFGVILGIAFWLALYVIADYTLLRANRQALSRRLTYSALLRALLQCYPWLDLFAGIYAIGTYEWLFSVSIEVVRSSDGLPGASVPVDFDVTFILTILTGLYLSIICALIFLLISLGSYILKKVKGIRSTLSEGQ